MADELRIILIPGPEPGATLKLSSPGIENPVFPAMSGEDEGGSIGTNIIGPEFRKYLDQLSPEDPITFEVHHVTESDVLKAEELAVEHRRHVVLLELND